MAAARSRYPEQLFRSSSRLERAAGPVLLLGGYQEGKDETLTSSAYGSRNKNKGYFAEADETARGLRRYDSYDLSDLKSGDKRTRYMVVANKALANGLQAIA